MCHTEVLADRQGHVRLIPYSVVIFAAFKRRLITAGQ